MSKKEFICEKIKGETVEYSDDGDYVITCGDVKVIVSAYYGYIGIEEKGCQIFYVEFEGGRRK